MTRKVVVVGSGIGGLAAAVDLAAQGLDVTVLEQAGAPGGKMRETEVDGRHIDAGPTVLTMRWVFDAIFAGAGANLDERLTMKKAEVLARHAWSETERLDLFADEERSVEAIGDFAGAAEAKRYREFCARSRATFDLLEGSFITAAEPTPLSLTLGAGVKGLGNLWRIAPFTTLWSALGTYFHDARLRQLFGRYATYCGSSPFEAPATLMLIAHVEQRGVWLIDGGMHALAVALARLASERGAEFRYSVRVDEVMCETGGVSGVLLQNGEHIACDAIIVNSDAAAVAAGLLGSAIANAVPPVAPAARSLSALTWALVARADGFPLTRHNVFFSGDYPAEFHTIFKKGTPPHRPTVYVCAQDRSAGESEEPTGDERLLCLINAPAIGDTHNFTQQEIERCGEQTFGQLARCGLRLEPHPGTIVTTPSDFARLYAGTGGALYGQASHGWTASFTRPRARTKVPGLYLAGGSVHPGPGVPMAALSGRLAAAALWADLTSGAKSSRAATPGGMSTRSVTTAARR